MSDVRCASCEQQKDKLHRVQSTIIPSLELTLCPSCKHDGYEPRWVIILGARSGANKERIRAVVSEGRYYGDDIKLREVLA